MVSVRFSDGDLAAVKRVAGERPLSTWLKGLAADAVAACDALEASAMPEAVPLADGPVRSVGKVVRHPEPVKGYSRIDSPEQVPVALGGLKLRPVAPDVWCVACRRRHPRPVAVSAGAKCPSA